MAAQSSAEVDYLETVHPLDYPVFQSLISNQFATRRRLPMQAKPTARENPSTLESGSSAKLPVVISGSGSVDMLDNRSNDSVISGRSSSSDQCGIPDLSKLFVADMNYSAIVASDNRTVSRSYDLQPGTSFEPPTPGISKPNPTGPRTPSTDLQTRSLEVGRRKRLRKEKTVSFAGFRRAMNPHRAVCGSFHQGSINRGLSQYMGSQCTTIGLVAIMASKSLPVHTWIPTDIDSIIRSGDKLHETLMSALQRTPDEGHLKVEEINPNHAFTFTIPAPLPDVANWSENNTIRLKMSLRKSQTYRGHLLTNSKSNRTGEVGLHDALCRIFEQDFDGALVNIGDSKGTVLRDLRGRVRYFDSHNNNKYGRLSRNGTAILLRFPTVRCFVQHLKRKESRGCRFQAVGVSFRVQERVALGHQINNTK